MSLTKIFLILVSLGWLIGGVLLIITGAYNILNPENLLIGIVVLVVGVITTFVGYKCIQFLRGVKSHG